MRLLTSRYRPAAGKYWEAASVMAPAFREDPQILHRAIESWLVAGAAEIVLVVPEDEPELLRNLAGTAAADPRIRVLTTSNPAKRNSLTLGIEAATKPIVVLSDSDTLWEPALLRNLLQPFADPAVGGVGTRQRVLDPGSSVWRRAADWMLDAKYLTYVPAMARRGGVSCLSGRTVAYRRDVLMEVLPGLPWSASASTPKASMTGHSTSGAPTPRDPLSTAVLPDRHGRAAQMRNRFQRDRR